MQVTQYTGSEVKKPVTIPLFGKCITTLDVNQEGFYAVSRTSENMTIKVIQRPAYPIVYPHVQIEGLKALAVSVLKESVIWMYADLRGIYLEYNSPMGSTVDNFTLHVQWKELDIAKPNKSHFDNLLPLIKASMIERYFTFIITKGSKARKAILKTLDSIAFTMFEQYNIGKDYILETGTYGGWNLRKGTLLARRDIELQQIVIGMLIRENKPH